jgi:hypothetical protein
MKGGGRMDEKTSWDELFSQLFERALASALEKQRGAAAGRVQQRLLTLEHAAEYLGMTPEALKAKRAQGLIQSVPLDKKLRFDINDLDELIDRSKEPR